jgi:hypothetical protein
MLKKAIPPPINADKTTAGSLFSSALIGTHRRPIVFRPFSAACPDKEQ